MEDRESLATRATPRSNKKQKSAREGDENELRAPRGTRSAKKRKAEQEDETFVEAHDFEMADVNEPVLPASHATRRSLSRSMAEAAAVRSTDQSCLAVPVTSHAAVSPFKHVMSDGATQTTKVDVYEQAYIDFLEESHAQALQSKDEELAELRKKVAKLNGQVQRLEAELKKEKERAGFERGWKKHF